MLQGTGDPKTRTEIGCWIHHVAGLPDPTRRASVEQQFFTYGPGALQGPRELEESQGRRSLHGQTEMPLACSWHPRDARDGWGLTSAVCLY